MENNVDQKAIELLDGMIGKLEKMDITSDNYVNLLDSMTNLYEQVNESTKNKVALSKTLTEAESEKLKAKSNEEIEEKRSKSNEKIATRNAVGTFIAGAIAFAGSLVTAIIGFKSNKAMIEAADRRFEMATRKEYDEPIVTLTNKTTVQDGLRNSTPHKFF